VVVKIHFLKRIKILSNSNPSLYYETPRSFGVTVLYWLNKNIQMSAGFVWRDLLKCVGGYTLFKIQLNLGTPTEYITMYPHLYSTGYVGLCIHSSFSKRFGIYSSYRLTKYRCTSMFVDFTAVVRKNRPLDLSWHFFAPENASVRRADLLRNVL